MSDLATGMALQGQHTAAFKIFEEIGNIARDKHTDLYPGIKVNVGNMHLQVRLINLLIAVAVIGIQFHL